MSVTCPNCVVPGKLIDGRRLASVGSLGKTSGEQGRARPVRTAGVLPSAASLLTSQHFTAANSCAQSSSDRLFRTSAHDCVHYRPPGAAEHGGQPKHASRHLAHFRHLNVMPCRAASATTLPFATCPRRYGPLHGDCWVRRSRRTCSISSPRPRLSRSRYARRPGQAHRQSRLGNWRSSASFRTPTGSVPPVARRGWPTGPPFGTGVASGRTSLARSRSPVQHCYRPRTPVALKLHCSTRRAVNRFLAASRAT